MTFEEKIYHALNQNSQWTGSPDTMWEEISAELPKKTPWWKQNQLWIGTMAAAVLLLVLFSQIGEPPPPVETEQEPVLMRSFMVEPERIMEAASDEVINMTVELTPVLKDGTSSPFVHLYKIGPDGNGETVSKTALENWESLEWTGRETAEITVPVQAPAEPGLYYISIEGVVQRNGESLVLTGERSFVVHE